MIVFLQTLIIEIKVKRISLLVVFCISAIVHTQAQTQEECIVMVKDIYRKAYEISEEGKTGLYAKYSVTTKASFQGQLNDYEEEMELYVYKGKSKAISQQFEIFKDSKIQVSVIKKDRTILITNTAVNESKDMYANIFYVQQKLLEQSTVIFYKRDIKNNKLILDMALSDEMQKYYGIKQITYEVDATKKEISGFRMKYNEGSQVKESYIRFLQTDFSYSKPVYTGTAKNQVMDDKGRLFPAYSHYQLINKSE